MYWLKCSKIVLKKQNLDQKKKWLKISYLEFINFRFFGRKSQNQQKLAKKITHFKTQFRSKNFTHFMNLNSLNIIKIILLQHNQRNVSGWCQKKHFHGTISRRPRTALSKYLESKRLHIVVNLCEKMFVPWT